MIFRSIYTGIFILLSHCSIGQCDLSGQISDKDNPIEFATVTIEELGLTSLTNQVGYFEFLEVPYGSYQLSVASLGYTNHEQGIQLTSDNTNLEINVQLHDQDLSFNTVVVTGTKTASRQTDSPVIVNVLNSKSLDHIQACSVSEGLNFQPGLRVETDCQTCNYTQLRMNGLAGGYSQILINGRPIFSPLTGLYGLEQLPVNMVDRIEVVRGGGSSLYGSSAIGGTVNIITKIPRDDSFEASYTLQNINGQTNDHIVNTNATLVSENLKSGLSFFTNHRERGLYDHNEDDFSEIPLIENTSFGVNSFFQPTSNQKIEASVSHLSEYRYGGEITDRPAYQAAQSEERSHSVWMGSLDYQINLNNLKSSFISYLAWQNTKRKHYTGILPDDPTDLDDHWENPPYGNSLAQTVQGGIQFNHRFNHFISGPNVITLGTEYIVDEVYDEISSYNYLIDQTTEDFGVFAQSNWDVTKKITLLSGVRLDKHNLLSEITVSPRFSMLFKHKENTQFRLSYGTGFRAPQAFDADLHIAFAGGGISRVSLSPNLTKETSQSLSASVNYDKVYETFVAGFTAEVFYTDLFNAFYLQPIGEDEFGELFEKQNGQGATVKGSTLELRANYMGKAQLEVGFTMQNSKFNYPVQYIDEIQGIREFTRTPNEYGFASLSFFPNKRFGGNINFKYTGEMLVPHFAGAPNQLEDEIVTTPSFSDLSFKLNYSTHRTKMGVAFQFYTGIKNVLNSYQAEFDIGKNRDSNFVFGPSLPRTFFFGVKISSI